MPNYQFRSNADGSLQLDPAVSSGDFGRVLLLKQKRRLTDQEKYFLLTNYFQPGPGYHFPIMDCRGGSRGGVTGVRTPPIHIIQ